MTTQTIRYCSTPTAGRIAFATCGKGSTVIRAAHWMTHLQHDLESPVWRHLLLGLAQYHRVVRYDSRGEGLSNRQVEAISFDGWLEDLECVADSVSAPRFALLGTSQGAATAIAYAVRHPERVSHLILYGGFARGMAHWAKDETRGDDLDLARKLIRTGWGSDKGAYRQWFSSIFLPGGTLEQYRWFNDLQRLSATPEMAERHLVATAQFDVMDLLPQVRAPTLVLHCRGDLVAPFWLGEEIAAGIPDARFVPLPGDNHLFLAGTPAHREFMEAVGEFLGDPPLKGPLPGSETLVERLDSTTRAIEQNWLTKIAVIVATITGIILAGIEFWKLAAGG